MIRPLPPEWVTAGTYEGASRVEIDAGELAMLLEGIDAPKVRRRKRYVHPQVDTRVDGGLDLS